MRVKSDGLTWISVLVVLLSINYMVGTIICKDIAPVKYLRDIILIAFLCVEVFPRKVNYHKKLALFLMLVPFMVIGVLKAPSFSDGLIVLRRYLFPIGMLVATLYSRYRFDVNRVGKWVLFFFALLALFGVFQAHVLGDQFLRDLGYPLEYSYRYKRDMLYNSFYFGGFGIQRVVATFSSSNICGLAFGMAILFILFIYPYMKTGIKENVLFGILILGYVLTVSRSNFLALIVVVVLMVWPYIPHKKWIFTFIFVALFFAFILGYAQGRTGLLYGLYRWVGQSLNFTEDSAAGRAGIWRAALEQIVHSPLGIGFGHVGGMADSLGNTTVKFSSESSYLAMALDMGWFAVLAYLIIWFSFVSYLSKKSKIFYSRGMYMQSRVCKASYIILLYFMMVMFFSNHIYDMEVVSFAYIYIGMAIHMCGERQSMRIESPATVPA